MCNNALVRVGRNDMDGECNIAIANTKRMYQLTEANVDDNNLQTMQTKPQDTVYIQAFQIFHFYPKCYLIISVEPSMAFMRITLSVEMVWGVAVIVVRYLLLL